MEGRRVALVFSNGPACPADSSAETRDALRSLSDLMGFWTDFGLEPDSRPRFLMNKHRRARSEARQKTPRARPARARSRGSTRGRPARLRSRIRFRDRCAAFVFPRRARRPESSTGAGDARLDARGPLDARAVSRRQRRGRSQEEGPCAVGLLRLLEKDAGGRLAALDAAEGQGRGFPPEALDDLETRAIPPARKTA